MRDRKERAKSSVPQKSSAAGASADIREESQTSETNSEIEKTKASEYDMDAASSVSDRSRGGLFGV